MGLFSSEKAKEEARQNPGKAIGMLRKMIGRKKMTADVMEMVVENLPKDENPVAENVTRKVGWYGVEHGYTYNHWLNLITIGHLDSYVTNDVLNEMTSEEIIEMLEKNMDKELEAHPDVHESLKARGWI